MAATQRSFLFLKNLKTTIFSFGLLSEEAVVISSLRKNIGGPFSGRFCPPLWRFSADFFSRGLSQRRPCLVAF